MRIVVVGGVAAGMSAAARARRLDENAEIIILERGEHVSFANCGLPYYVGGEITSQSKLLVQTPQSLHNSLNLDVRTHHNVIGLDAAAKEVTVQTPQAQEKLSYDALILAPGAVAARPSIAGLTNPRVTTLRTVDDAVKLRDTVTSGITRGVVLGAGFIGLEAAEALAHRGLAVDLVEYAPHVLPPLEDELAVRVARELTRIGVTVHSGVAATAIEEHADDAAADVVLSDGTRIPSETIVLSAGVRPDTAVFEAAGVACERGAIIVDEHGRTNLPDVYAAGDATLSTDAVTGVRRPVALAGPANRAGRQIADFIIRPEHAQPIPSALGTAIVRVGELTVAMTGANRRALDSAGIEYHTLHLHPAQHAGYFPGATTMALIVHIRANDGLILGAQAVGKEGVDKRIDVLATTIRAHMRAADLIDLDLAYAPPYGSAKDAINMVGMVGSNVVDGTLKLWYAEDLAELQKSCFILDVRTPREYATGHLPGVPNIPHVELRERLDEVKRLAGGRPVRILCQSGVRSYIAHRILVNAGFDSASMSGGMNTLVDVLGTSLLEK